MSKISRIVVMVTALISVFAAMTSSAGAVSTWKSTNTTPFTADSGPVSISGNGTTLSCTSGTATGAATALDFTGAIWTNAIHGNMTFSGCILGGTPWHWSCTYSLNATGYSSLTHVVNATLNLNAPNDCTASVAGVTACTIEGTLPASYDNPPDAKLTIPAGSLTVTNGPSTHCPLIAGAGTHGVLARTAQTYTVTGANAPTITGT
jgi:hypothetical protein